MSLSIPKDLKFVFQTVLSDIKQSSNYLEEEEKNINAYTLKEKQAEM